MKDNEYTRKEQICPLAGTYCNEEHKNCDRCIAEEEEYEENEELFTHIPNSDETVDLHLNQKVFNKAIDQFCNKKEL